MHPRELISCAHCLVTGDSSDGLGLDDDVLEEEEEEEEEEEV